MKRLTFSTGNDVKFEIGRAVCGQADIDLARRELEIDEIQGEDSELIIRDKVQKAYEALQEAVVVSDDSWLIPALGGFPGPYMKSMNHWLSPEDFLRLVEPLTDRRIILVQLLAYQDATHQQVFRKEYVGELLTEARGNRSVPSQTITTMPGDNGLSIAEAHDRGLDHANREVAACWREFIEWYENI